MSMRHSYEPFDVTGPLPTGTTVLEASAGTGKTYALSTLVLRHVAETDLRISQIMMVTFSRAATQELRERVRVRLREATAAFEHHPAVPSDPVLCHLLQVDDAERALRHRRVRQALVDYDQAMITTTHGFCHAMLTELGVLADPEPQPLMVEDLTDLAREVASDLYVTRYARQSAPPLIPDQVMELAKRIGREPSIEIGPRGEVDRGTEELRSFGQAIVAEIKRRKDRTGLYGFDDMQERLWEALRDDPDDPAQVHRAAVARERLATRFPLVLVDEFQDTDPRQWSILREGFQGRATLVLIGDPKQAIYAFRGADVHSYLTAVRSVHAGTVPGQVRTLATNHRTDARLVETLGHLMQSLCLGDDLIHVHPVAAVHPQRMHAQGEWAAPVRLRVPVSNPWGDLPSWDQMKQRVADDVVADVVGLLMRGEATLDLDGAGPRPVTPGDIAILVSSHAMGRLIHARLRQANVPVAYTGGSSVFESPAAQDWLDVLHALATPRVAEIRRAALTSLIGLTLRDLAEDSDTTITQLADTFRGWNRVLEEEGVPALTEAVLRHQNVAKRLLSTEDGPRRLTDLRHLAQLLHAAAPRRTGAVGLEHWLQEQCELSASVDQEGRVQRLEIDSDAVTIQTIHASKGLEHPIVYLPESSFRFSPKDKGLPIVHHVGATRVLDVGGSGKGRSERWQLHLAEEQDEELRKLYVGLTRATCQVTMWWAPARKFYESSALHRVLLRPLGDTPATPPHTINSAVLEDSAVLSHPGIAIQHMPDEVAPARYEAPSPSSDAVESTSLRAATLRHGIDGSWRRTSYSGLTALSHGNIPLGTRDPDEPEQDPLAAPLLRQPDPRAQQPSPLADMGGGTTFGSAVHAILEVVDPAASNVHDFLLHACHQMLQRFPVGDITPETLAQALLPSLHTPLGSIAPTLTLADIGMQDRLAELEFEMPLGSGSAATLRTVADLLQSQGMGHPLLESYPERLRSPELGDQLLRGFLTGSIDAVLRLPGAVPRFVVVDYKTNRLAPPGAPLLIGHYDQASMAAAMMDSHYPLQALLYSVALHRFLRWRLRGYDPHQHLGGIGYLFLRGMAGADGLVTEGQDAGHAHGVFDWHPSAELVVALSDLLGGAC